MDPPKTPVNHQIPSPAMFSPTPLATPQWHKFPPNPDHIPGPSNNWRSQLSTQDGWTWECINTLCWCQSDLDACKSNVKAGGCMINASAVGSFCDNCKNSGCVILSEKFFELVNGDHTEQLLDLIRRQQENIPMNPGRERTVLQVIRDKAVIAQAQKMERDRTSIENSRQALVVKKQAEAKEKEEAEAKAEAKAKAKANLYVPLSDEWEWDSAIEEFRNSFLR